MKKKLKKEVVAAVDCKNTKPHKSLFRTDRPFPEPRESIYIKTSSFMGYDTLRDVDKSEV